MERLMTTKAQLLTIITLGATLVVASAQTTQTAAAAPTSPAPALSSTEQTIKDIKNPLSWMSWGADLRLRNEYFYDLITLNPHVALHEQDYFRFRGRVWTSIMPVDDLSLNARLAAEPREWMDPAGYSPMKLLFPPPQPARGKVGPDWTEGVFDNLNVKWKNIAGQPLTATVGRQDIFLGDGWLVGDGTPFDGSWTYFLDSARFAYEIKDLHTTVEAIGIIQSAHDAAWLPVIGADQNRLFTEQNEKGAILQVANTSMKAANLTGYFIYKHDDAATMTSDQVRSFHPDNADIYTIGGRVNGSLSDNWKYWIEGAYQFGRKAYPGLPANPYVSAGTFRDIDAFGLNSKLTYMFKDKLNNQLTMSCEFLSGDDPNSKGNDEMFDVLWGRWPRWSEIGLYMFPAETRIGQEANLIRFGPTWSLNPIKDLEFSASYYALFAPHDVPTIGAIPPASAGGPLFTDSGNFRGHFASAALKYKFSQHMSGHLWSEFLFPGDYYVYKSMMTFLRAEVMFTF
jgi:Alginate export